MEKEFKTNRKLIKILRRRNINIDKTGEGSQVISILETENYYNVINGYKDLFIKFKQTDNNEDIYKNGTKFGEIYSLYCFDRNIRIIYLNYLLKIENMLKTVIAYEFSCAHGYKNFLKIENFDALQSNNHQLLAKIASRNRLNLKIASDLARAKTISKEYKIESITSLFASIEKGVSQQLNKRKGYISHYAAKHGYMPLWILVNVMSFGNMTSFYNNMKTEDKIAVAKKFHINYKDLYNYMLNLGLSRNLCAHSERFFDVKFKNSLKINNIVNFNLLNIPVKNGNCVFGTKDVYSIAIIFTLFLKKKDVKNFVNSIDFEFTELGKKLKTISVDDVKNKMGFGNSWKNLDLICHD